MERDPRWGRNQEATAINTSISDPHLSSRPALLSPRLEPFVTQAPGEDPHLTGQYIAHYVRGLQEGEDPDHVQIVATCKHFIANSLEHSTINGSVVTRHNFDGPPAYRSLPATSLLHCLPPAFLPPPALVAAEIPLPDLVDYYMPGFKACVQQGKALGIMCATPPPPRDFLVRFKTGPLPPPRGARTRRLCPHLAGAHTMLSTAFQCVPIRCSSQMSSETSGALTGATPIHCQVVREQPLRPPTH